MNTIKKIAAGLIATMTMATSVAGISANAATMNSYQIWLTKYAGSPSGAGSTYQSWVFTTTGTTISYVIDVFTKSDGASDSFVRCLATVQGSTIIYADLHSANPVSGTVLQGRNGTASAELKCYNSGNHHAEGNFFF